MRKVEWRTLRSGGEGSTAGAALRHRASGAATGASKFEEVTAGGRSKRRWVAS